ncbi:T6SS immunity protein Tli4 family protein [Trinickia symbiotica]|uniref:T6SS immunity protein Tli4 family protein n=1 Tax=Trinickia symbiotica TaxID=863227 RepID=UPI000363C19F|nr:T6SS immunity protein Tli4 family protein [Trinickia symbiotica]
MRTMRFAMALCASLLTPICYAKEPAMSDTKTYCIGRFLVDVPADAEINGQAYEYMFGRIDSTASTESEEHCAQEMIQRGAELRAGQHKKQYALTGVKSPSTSIRIFELSRTLLTGPSVGVEAYKWDNGYVFSMKETGFDLSRYSSVLSTLETELLPNLRARTTDEVPSQPGFCLKNGFIANDGKTAQYEEAGMSFRFSRWPGVVVTVNVSTTTKAGEKTLLQRIDSTPVPAVLQGVIVQMKTLRKGKREVNGREGEEVLWTFPTEEGFRTHQFQWEAQGTLDQPLRPDLTVEFESGARGANGAPQRPRLSDEEAIRVFDAIVNSVRLRPADGGKVSESGPSTMSPLGTLAQTGTRCPQTGWWTCPEAAANQIEGGRRQRFEAGNAMPVVHVLAKQSFIERMTGRQQKHSVNTVWKLVAYDGSAVSGESIPPEH